MEVCGVPLPKGTMLSLSVFSLHWNPAVWGEDARHWRPERWLEGRSINAVKRDAAGHLRWTPFLHGVQNCIGQHLALVSPSLLPACAP